MCSHNQRSDRCLARTPPLFALAPRVFGTMFDTACGTASSGSSVPLLRDIADRCPACSRICRIEYQSPCVGFRRVPGRRISARCLAGSALVSHTCTRVCSAVDDPDRQVPDTIRVLPVICAATGRAAVSLESLSFQRSRASPAALVANDISTQPHPGARRLSCACRLLSQALQLPQFCPSLG